MPLFRSRQTGRSEAAVYERCTGADLVTANGIGSATITVTSVADATKTATAVITVTAGGGGGFTGRVAPFTVYDLSTTTRYYGLYANRPRGMPRHAEPARR